MALALHRTLFLLPLFLVTVHSQLFPNNPFFGGSNEDEDNDPGLKLPGINSPLFGGSTMGDVDKFDPGANPPYETNYKGSWILVSADSGANAMHVNLLPNNKVILFDATAFHMSTVKLPHGECIPYKDDKKVNRVDCWSHGTEFDIQSAAKRPLKVNFGFHLHFHLYYMRNMHAHFNYQTIIHER